MNILIVQGHPDAAARHYCHALAEAYARGAEGAGHAVETIDVGAAPVDFVRSQDAFERGEPPAYARKAQEAIARADHLVVVFPLWMGGMPALLKAWLEQVFRYGFAMEVSDKGWTRKLKHKSARLIVTMGMPAFFYRAWFGAHGTGVLRRSILGLSGVGPIRQTLVGRIGSRSREDLARKLEEVERLGAAAR